MDSCLSDRHIISIYLCLDLVDQVDQVDLVFSFLEKENKRGEEKRSTKNPRFTKYKSVGVDRSSGV
jgi:hypothetical protein